MTCKCDHVDTVPLEAFREHVQLHCALCPTNVIDFYVRTAAIELARRSLNMQRDIWIDLQAGVHDYEICLDDVNLHLIRQVCCGEEELHPVTKLQCCPGSGNYYYYEKPNKLLLGRTPQEDCPEGLFVRAIVKPRQDACTLDECYYEDFAETIATGALSRIMIMDKPWRDVQAGGIMRTRWKEFMNAAKVEHTKGGSAGPKFVKIPRFV